MCRAARPGARHPLTRSVEWAGTRGAPGGRPSPKGSGRGQVSAVGEATPDNCSKLGRGFLRWGRSGRDKQGGAGESGRPPPPSLRRHCRSALRPAGRCPPPPHPPAPGPGRRLGPAAVQSVGSSGPPAPPAAAPPGPRAAHLARREQQRGPGSSRSGSSAQLRAAAAAVPPAHPARPAAPLGSGRSPAEAGSRPPGRPALPLRDTALTYAAAATTRPGFPAREGSAGARQPASERASSAPGHTSRRPHRPPPPAPAPAAGVARARGPRLLPPATRARTAPAPAPRAPGAHSPGARAQWALRKCPGDSSRTCALGPDRAVTPGPLPPESEPAAAARTKLERWPFLR